MRDFLKKQVSITSVLLLCSIILIGQGICAIANDGDWEVTPEDNMFAIPDGNVGIGIEVGPPEGKLSIGHSVTQVDTSSPHILLIDTIDNQGNLKIGFEGRNRIGFVQADRFQEGHRPLVLNPSGGNVGIGTISPGAALQINTGDVYVQGNGRGLILRSNGGNCFQVTVSDAGTLTTSPVTCP